MIDPVLERRAYREAAALLRAEMDSIDLPPDLTEEEEDAMREFIRNTIADELEFRSI